MRNRPRAIALMDALVATGLTGVLLSVSIATMTSMSQARRATESRAVAIELAASAIERARGLTWDELNVEHLDEIARASAIDGVVPRAQMKLSVEPSTVGPASKHVWVEVVWTNTTGGAVAPVRLDYWVFAPEGASP